MLYLLLYACAPQEPLPTALAERGDLQVFLDVKGELEAAKTVSIINPLRGWPEIAFIADEGTRVKAGDLVVELDVEDRKKRLVELESQLAVSRTRIEQARARLSMKLGDARTRVLLAELDAELAELRQTDSLTVPRIEREQTRIEAQRAELTLGGAAGERRRVELDAAAEIELLELEATKADLSVRSLKRQIEAARLVAPEDGLVLIEERWDGKYKVGTEVPNSSTIVSLPDVENLKVVGWVHEVDSPKVALGQRGQVHMDAHPDAKVTGTVESLATLAIKRGDHGERYLRTELSLSQTLEQMKPGMTVETRLLVDEVEDGVLVPSASVFVDAEGPFVWAGDDRIRIDVLADDGDRAAVDGLDAGTSVATFSPEAWARGERPLEADE